MTSGKIDLSMVNDSYEYLIVYSEPGDLNKVNTWVLPDESFQHNYKAMKSRGVKIHGVFKRMSADDLLDAIVKG